jgi:hypothetical protein
MNVDDRRFLRRHFPSFANVPGLADDAVDGEAIAVRSDGVVFYIPSHSPDSVFVGWLIRNDEGLSLKSTPATRRICSLEEYNAEMSTRSVELVDLLGYDELLPS